MELKSEKYSKITNPNSTDIYKSVNLLNSGDNRFLILSSTKYNYIQVAKTNISLEIEYQLKSIHNHFICKNKLSEADVLGILNSYNLKTEDWLNKYKWEKLEVTKSPKTIKKISSFSLYLSIILFALIIWNYKSHHGTDLRIFGMIFIYPFTIFSILLAIGFLDNLLNWENTSIRLKIDAVGSLVLSLLLILISILSLLGIINFK